MIDALQTILQRYRRFDVNADGDAAIEEATYLDFEDPSDVSPMSGRFTLVFVEQRLLEDMSGSTFTPADIRSRLIRLKGDLRAVGLYSRFLQTRVYSGPRHQDGRTLLALRELLRETRTIYPNLQGVLFIGAFPEAMLVRRWIWRTKRDVTAGGKVHINADHLRIVPEIVAHRADLILADLDGAWQNLYQEAPTQIQAVEALPAASVTGNWPQDGQTFVSDSFNHFEETYEDFFFIDDADWTQLTSPPGQLRLLIRATQLHPELNAADRGLPNPLARPNISVSRINSRNVAASPDPSRAPWLDTMGRPQAFTSATAVDTGPNVWVPVPELERRLLVEYLDRNHRFRVGSFRDLPHRGAAVAEEFSAASMLSYLNKAASDFVQGLTKEDASLVDYVDFLKQPATLRGVYAHADAWGTQYSDHYQAADLENTVGGHPWRWKRQDSSYAPSLEEQQGKADLYLHRTVWENRIMEQSGASLWVHGGCLANSPGRASSRPYNDPGYAVFQNAESILFYLEGVAVIARAKVFFDLPSGFTSALASSPRASFGEAWRAMFNVEAGNAALMGRPADCKRVYNWSVLGDWTLRVNNHNGLGILCYSNELVSLAVQPNDAWIGRWNYSSNLNKVEAIGDIDGDGKAELVIRSDWGIGILGHDGQRWQDLLVASDDTWFGSWRYNASVNTGEDSIHGVARLSAPDRTDLLLTSSWGIGVLTWSGDSLTTVLAHPNGTRFGGWWFDSRANRIEHMADFDGDGRDEILVSSDWGIGILKLQDGQLTSIMMAPNGTRFGEWLLNTADNHFFSLGNLTGIGGDDLIVTSPWGIGLFTLADNSMDAWFVAPNGTSFGGWQWNSADNKVIAAGDIDGDGRKELLVTSPWGMAILEPRGPRLEPVVIAPNDTRFNGWRWNSADNRIVAAGDIDGDGRDELIVTSPWGIGVLGLAGTELTAKFLAPYPSRLGDWVSDANDCWIGMGDFSGTSAHELLIQKKG